MSGLDTVASGKKSIFVRGNPKENAASYRLSGTEMALGSVYFEKIDDHYVFMHERVSSRPRPIKVVPVSDESTPYNHVLALAEERGKDEAKNRGLDFISECD